MLIVYRIVVEPIFSYTDISQTIFGHSGIKMASRLWAAHL